MQKIKHFAIKQTLQQINSYYRSEKARSFNDSVVVEFLLQS